MISQISITALHFKHLSQNVKRLKFYWQTLEQQAKVIRMLKSFEGAIELARKHLENQRQLKKQLLITALSNN